MLKYQIFLVCILWGLLQAGNPMGQRFNLTASPSSGQWTQGQDHKSAQNGLTYNSDKYRLVRLALSQSGMQTMTLPEKKSPVKAAFLSALLPGAGQYYSKSFWKSAVFAAIEVGAITAYIHYNNSGDSKDRQMRLLGDTQWSEQRYWSKVYMLAQQANKWDYSALQVGADGVISAASYNQTTINHLREVEVQGGFPGFTHELPHTKTQQYYEMIYKYLDQFGAGWNEVGTDWTYYDSYASLDHLLPNLSRYKKIRNESNDLYRVAFYASVSILANHIISALEAAYSLHKKNKGLQYSLHSSTTYYAGNYIPELGLAISW